MKGRESILIFQPALVRLIFSTSLFFQRHDLEQHGRKATKETFLSLVSIIEPMARKKMQFN